MKTTIADRLVAAIQFLRDQLTQYSNQTKSDPFNLRNAKLLEARCQNIISIRDELQTIIGRIEFAHNFGQVDEQTHERYLYDIRRALNDGLTRNKTLSVKYGFIHRTFHENQLAGLSLFSCWVHKTFFQSRAARTIEKALEYLDEFELALSKIIENERPSSSEKDQSLCPRLELSTMSKGENALSYLATLR